MVWLVNRGLQQKRNSTDPQTSQAGKFTKLSNVDFDSKNFGASLY